jgi:hypothetical protein
MGFCWTIVALVVGIDEKAEQSWQRYAGSLIIYSAVALGVSYAFFRLQAWLPFNPQHLPNLNPSLAWNTSVSFVTNTNWQAYSGESTMSYLSQMASLAVQNHGPGRAADARRTGAHSRRAQRREPDHPARPGGVPGDDQAAWHQRRRLLQRHSATRSARR